MLKIKDFIFQEDWGTEEAASCSLRQTKKKALRGL